MQDRITLKQAQRLYTMAVDIWHHRATILAHVAIPAIDMDAMFAGRKTMKVADIINEIGAAIDEANTNKQAKT